MKHNFKILNLIASITDTLIKIKYSYDSQHITPLMNKMMREVAVLNIALELEDKYDNCE